MKVAQVNSVFGRGSTGRIAALIHRAVVRRGWDAHSYFGRGAHPGMANVHQFGGRAEMLLQGAETRAFDRHALGSRLATRELMRALESLAPDVVQLHNLHGYYVNLPMLVGYLRRSGVPTVWTLHDAWAFTGHCTHFDRIGCERWRTTCHHCPQRHEYPASMLVDRSTRNQALKRELVSGWDELTLVTPSRWLGSLAEPSAVGGPPLHVIANDPDFSVFAPTTSAWRSDRGLNGRFLILCVANVWENRKGLHVVRDFAPLLRDDETVVVIGKLLDPTELPAGAVYLEHTENATELAEIYSAADVYLNPTLEDTYPTTNLEAMACGTPCITFPTGGSPETLERGTGIVTTAKTPTAIRQAIDQLRDSPFCLTALDRGATPMEERYAALYRSLV